MSKFETQLNQAYCITRRSDGLEFQVILAGHWSDIRSLGNTGECDSVKFYGSDGPGRDLLVGATSGHTYLRVKR